MLPILPNVGSARYQNVFAELHRFRTTPAVRNLLTRPDLPRQFQNCKSDIMDHSSTTSPTVTLRAESYQSRGATEMIQAATRANEALYGHPDQSPLDPEEFSPLNRGQFLVAYLDDTPVGCGGYRRHHDDDAGTTAEIKRMYVEPGARRLGIARTILAQLENEALNNGYNTVILDTGSKQHAAHTLYESCGYQRTTGFGIYRDKPGNRAYRKSLKTLV
ncbi:GNAT family N-acetyltransferase [Nocardia rhamnosiphila]|uniref:GNAT family N-acetyltransferase n=1 Tax=Nocardia rhamnosiphila TaxID=426716 RepID=UPI0033D142F5